MIRAAPLENFTVQCAKFIPVVYPGLYQRLMQTVLCVLLCVLILSWLNIMSVDWFLSELFEICCVLPINSEAIGFTILLEEIPNLICVLKCYMSLTVISRLTATVCILFYCPKTCFITERCFWHKVRLIEQPGSMSNRNCWNSLFGQMDTLPLTFCYLTKFLGYLTSVMSDSVTDRLCIHAWIIIHTHRVEHICCCVLCPQFMQ